ncbi:hypothetical protein [Alteraurantiacibacter buctensis]|nr:hypothetical protein [Alteraurantiacibacter buctensis]
MKRVMVLAGALALAACGNGTGEGDSASAAPAPSATPAPVPTELVGTYGAQGADGRPWTTALAADGTYRNTVGGELTESGTWTRSGASICFTPMPVAEQAQAQTCQTLLNVNDDGSLVVRDAGGQETIAPRLADQPQQ